MLRDKPEPVNVPEELARRLAEALQHERIVPRFVDSYVVDNGRHALQVHASLYRDLLNILQREALLTIAVRSLQIATDEPAADRKSKLRPMTRRDATLFRRKFLTALTRHQKWNAGDALDFQSDLHRYEELLAPSVSNRRRKPFEAANHPFVDRSAFLLDSSFMEKARLAASRALNDIEELAAMVTEQVQGQRVR
jgi:hypothetical protein